MGGSRSEYSTWVALGIGGAYLLLKDCLFRGASLGKLIFLLVVVDARSGHPCGIMRSCRRNGVLCRRCCCGVVPSLGAQSPCGPQARRQGGWSRDTSIGRLPGCWYRLA